MEERTLCFLICVSHDPFFLHPTNLRILFKKKKKHFSMIHLDGVCHAIRPFKIFVMGRGHAGYLHSSHPWERWHSTNFKKILLCRNLVERLFNKHVSNRRCITHIAYIACILDKRWRRQICEDHKHLLPLMICTMKGAICNTNFCWLILISVFDFHSSFESNDAVSYLAMLGLLLVYNTYGGVGKIAHFFDFCFWEVGKWCEATF